MGVEDVMKEERRGKERRRKRKGKKKKVTVTRSPVKLRRTFGGALSAQWCHRCYHFQIQ
jgi:hypothetical protein